MSNDIIRADYEALEQVATRFEEEADRIRRVQQALTRQVGVLRAGGWTAEAAERFFQDMDNDVSPAVGRLFQSLKQSSTTTRQIVAIFKNAEEAAAACLNDQGTGTGIPGLPGFPGIPGMPGAPGMPGTTGDGTTFNSDFFAAYGDHGSTAKNGIKFKDYPYHLMDGAQGQGYLGYRRGMMSDEDVQKFLNKDPFARKPSDYVTYGATFAKDRVAGRVAAWEGSVSGDWGDASIRALSAEADAGYSVSWGKDGLQAKADFEAGAYLARATANAHVAGFDVAGDAYVGANIQGEASVAFNPLNGDARVKAGGEVFAGGKAGGEIKTSVGPVNVGAQGSVSYGIGATAKADVGMENGVVRADFKLGATLGLGLEGGFSVELDVPKAAETVVDAGSAAVDWVTFWD